MSLQQESIGNLSYEFEKFVGYGRDLRPSTCELLSECRFQAAQRRLSCINLHCW